MNEHAVELRSWVEPMKVGEAGSIDAAMEAAAAEIDRLQAERDRFRGHSQELNTVLWKLGVAMGLFNEAAAIGEGQIDEIVDEAVRRITASEAPAASSAGSVAVWLDPVNLRAFAREFRACASYCDQMNNATTGDWLRNRAVSLDAMADDFEAHRLAVLPGAELAALRVKVHEYRLIAAAVEGTDVSLATVPGLIFKHHARIPDMPTPRLASREGDDG